jgi:hypothetical protein
MSSIAILRPVMIVLAEGHRRPRKYFTIVWRGPKGEDGAGLHYQLERAREMAQLCGAREIVEEDVATEVSPAPRLADMSYADVQALREETL